MHGKLTTTLVDALTGKPASGLRLQIYWMEPTGDVLLRTTTTTESGTTSKPLLESSQFSAGSYRLLLHVGDYFAAQLPSDAPRFFEQLPVHFVVADASTDVCLDIVVAPTTYSVTRV
ncbi:MAG: hydroxyisourate hydrolase [Tepidisphaeraceae bacterium]